MSRPFTILSERFSRLSKRSRAAICIAILLPSFFIYIQGIDRNPPGFYIDEAASSYNAFTLYQKGEGEFGHKFPLYFPVFPLAPPLDYLGYVEPVQIYALAALYYVFPPGVTVSRGLSAASIFLAAMILGFLAFRVSQKISIGIIVALTAIATPWLFEMSRLAFSASMYPLAAAILLLVLFRASRRETWTYPDIVLIAISLSLTTYTYAIGRLMGPLFALGLLLLITNRRQIKGLILAWLGYALTLIPMLVFHFRNPEALTGRLTLTVGYMSAEKSYGQIFTEFIGHYVANISLNRLLFIGDLNVRHHIQDTAPILLITLVLAVVGFVTVLVKYRRDAWWRFVIFGLLVSVVPASFTKDDFHMLRLGAFPVFLLALSLPAYSLLTSKRNDRPAFRPSPGTAALAVVVMITAVQVFSFQVRFWESGTQRTDHFDVKYPAVFAAAIERPERPIYLVDQTYYHAYWQAITQGIDLSNFVRLQPMKRPPADSLVLSGEERCSDCDMIVKDIPYVLYKTRSGPPAASGQVLPGGGPIIHPRGIATEPSGGYYVADTGNARILKFDNSGLFVSSFGSKGEGEGQLKEPHGIAVDTAGLIYVTDSGSHKLARFKPDGSFDREWRGPDSGFYGPRDVAIGSDGKVYIVDQGRNRIVKYSPSDDRFSAFGSSGPGEGQFNDPTGIAIDGDLVLVADTGNRRIQIFDVNGKFTKQIPIPHWKAGEVSYPDVAIDDAAKRIFFTNPAASELLAYSMDGTNLETMRPDPRYVLRNPSGLAIKSGSGSRRLLVLNTGSGPLDQESCVAVFDLGIPRSETAPRR